MSVEVEVRYPVLTEAQIAKLPWNRLKNIMKPVRAVISSVEKYWGWTKSGYFDPDWVISPEFETREQRDAEVAIMLAPQYEYFNMLKKYAALLPHEPKKIKRDKNGNR